MAENIFSLFDKGTLATRTGMGDIAIQAWNEHPRFAGVFLKDLAGLEQTDGLLTCHLVRIEPHHAIGRHTHPGSLELHEVIEGSGFCRTEQGDLPYSPGTMAVIPRDAPHEVQAGEDGLCLFAKFITAPQADQIRHEKASESANHALS